VPSKKARGDAGLLSAVILAGLTVDLLDLTD
jgi:hypothetical protein